MADLGRELRKSSVLEDDSLDFEAAEADLVTELTARLAASGDSYPFAIEGSKLLLKSRFEDHLAYAFCLCLSCLGDDSGTEAFYPRRAFESLSSLAAQNYFQGLAVRFGAPRDSLPSKFDEAIHRLCILMGEGGGFRERGLRKGQDDTLDLVAWKDFPDRRPGKLLMFGQCASGRNWRSKTSELQPLDFCQLWLVDKPIVVIKGFFVPHCIEDRDWLASSVRSGMIFDRCRISYWAGRAGMIPLRSKCVRWCRKVLERGIQ